MCTSKWSQVSIAFLIVLKIWKHIEIGINRLLIILALAIASLWPYTLHISKRIPLFSSFDPFICRITLFCTLLTKHIFTQKVFAHVYFNTLLNLLIKKKLVFVDMWEWAIVFLGCLSCFSIRLYVSFEKR